MILRFSLRLLDAVEQLEEPLLRLDVDERDVEVLAEGLDHLLRLVLAQQAVVDEDARELLADRLVHEQRRHGRVDAARQRAQDALGPTWARIRATCSSITAAGVQAGGASASA